MINYKIILLLCICWIIKCWIIRIIQKVHNIIHNNKRIIKELKIIKDEKMNGKLSNGIWLKQFRQIKNPINCCIKLKYYRPFKKRWINVHTYISLFEMAYSSVTWSQRRLSIGCYPFISTNYIQEYTLQLSWNYLPTKIWVIIEKFKY